MDYADTSFLASLYVQDVHSNRAIAYLRQHPQSLVFTPLQRHELRNAVRLAVFRHEITVVQRDAALTQIVSDLTNGILEATPLDWSAVLNESAQLSDDHSETLGTRSLDILHVAAARVLGATEFLTFDTRQHALAQACGLHVLP